MLKIKEVTKLRKVLKEGGYGKIAVWKDGSWDLVSSGYAGEQSGDNPIAVLNASFATSTAAVEYCIINLREKLNS